MNTDSEFNIWENVGIKLTKPVEYITATFEGEWIKDMPYRQMNLALSCKECVMCANGECGQTGNKISAKTLRAHIIDEKCPLEKWCDMAIVSHSED